MAETHKNYELECVSAKNLIFFSLGPTLAYTRAYPFRSRSTCLFLPLGCATTAARISDWLPSQPECCHGLLPLQPLAARTMALVVAHTPPPPPRSPHAADSSSSTRTPPPRLPRTRHLPTATNLAVTRKLRHNPFAARLATAAMVFS